MHMQLIRGLFCHPGHGRSLEADYSLSRADLGLGCIPAANLGLP